MNRLFLLLPLFVASIYAQTPADRYRRCPDCFPGGPVYTNYRAQVRPPAYYPPVYYGGYGYRVSGMGRAAATMAAGAGMAIVLDEIQQRRAEAAERRTQRTNAQPVQLRNCRVYENTDKDAPMLMVCEDRDGNRITLEKER